VFQGKKVFVAGGRTGFVGTNIAKALLERGAVVYAHSRRLDVLGNLPPQTPNFIESGGDLAVAVDLPRGVEYVFHCAAHTSGAHEMVTDPTAQVTVNVFMNSLLLDAAAKGGVKKLLFVSSSAVYPDLDIPLPEDRGFHADPPDVYFGPAWMKRYTEKIAEFYYKRYGMEVVVIRPSNIYGPYSSFDPERAHVLPALIRKFVARQDPIEVWGTCDVVRDFIYVDDFVRGALLAFERSTGFSVYNIASGRQHTIGEAVEIIQRHTGYAGSITYNASKPMTVRKRVIDVSKATRELGFSAETPFEEGLRMTIDWYRARAASGA